MKKIVYVDTDGVLVDFQSGIARLIFSHNKHLNHGDYLIDDRNDRNGSDRFTGELIHFGSDVYPDWASVMRCLLATGVSNR